MTFLFGFLRSAYQGRQPLLLENLALRQQLAAYHRTRKRPALRTFEQGQRSGRPLHGRED